MHNQLKRREHKDYKSTCLIPQSSEIVKTVNLDYYAPQLYMPKHDHSVGQFSTLLSGKAYEYNLNGELYNRPGVAEFKPVAYSHSNRIGPDGALFLSINLHSDHEAFVAEFGRVNWKLIDQTVAKRLWHTLTLMLFQSERALNVDIDEVVLGLLSQSLPGNHIIKKAPVWLCLAEQALNETQMSLEEIARYVGVHRVHLSRVFQSYFSLSVSQYKQRVALQRSMTAMLREHDSISLAGAQAGFADQSHFTRTMKKQFGITPNRLRSLFSSSSVVA
ncbi:hypothetical protein D210916BOD24_04890 [Alteromonas sp. D210916BOD_24]|uniref:helix-turn-helix domain-containing protein n=1 Tax=Alteromonas sp. D210916BOD_24 TaxID=3157618 RepID=UPI00399D2C43